MFHHVKELQFNARVSGPDPRFASMLLEQFGGANGELAAAMQYFLQSFGVRQSHPEKYDMLMDIANEELSHLEIVGATITMLLEGVNAELQEVADKTGWMSMVTSKGDKEEMFQQAMTNPQFLPITGGGPSFTSSQGVPWSASYIHANGDLTVDLRTDLAAESRAKIVYERLLQFTDDPYVKESLVFLMTREIAHYKMFESALESIAHNFPPGVRQGDPHYTHNYFNLSNGASARGPWNEGQGTWDEGEWNYVEDPVKHVIETQGMTTNHPIKGTSKTVEEVEKTNRELGEKRSKKIKEKVPSGENQWSSYPQKEVASPKKVQKSKAGGKS